MNEEICRDTGLIWFNDNVRYGEAIFHGLGRADSVSRMNAHDGFAWFKSNVSNSHWAARDYMNNLAVKVNDVALFTNEGISSSTNLVEILSHLKDEFVIMTA